MQASSLYVERLVYFTKKLRRNERISSELPLYKKLSPLGLSILWYVRYLFLSYVPSIICILHFKSTIFVLKKVTLQQQ